MQQRFALSVSVASTFAIQLFYRVCLRHRYHYSRARLLAHPGHVRTAAPSCARVDLLPGLASSSSSSSSSSRLESWHAAPTPPDPPSTHPTVAYCAGVRPRLTIDAPRMLRLHLCLAAAPHVQRPRPSGIRDRPGCPAPRPKVHLPDPSRLQRRRPSAPSHGGCHGRPRGEGAVHAPPQGLAPSRACCRLHDRLASDGLQPAYAATVEGRPRQRPGKRGAS